MRHEYLQIRSNCLLIYELSEFPHRPKKEHILNQKAYNGTLTDGGRKRLLTALDIMVQRTGKHWVYSQEKEKWFPFRLNFVTLTLTNSTKVITAKEGHRDLLKPWLRYMRDKCDLGDYVWKAEQQKNGQLHYHLGTGTFLPQNLVRWKWNKEAKKAGLLEKFAKQYGHFNPPSTEVLSIVHVQDAKSYIAKEFAKTCQNQNQMGGKVWDCSSTLKRGYYSEILTNETNEKLRKGIQAGAIKVKQAEKCKILITNEPRKYLSPQVESRYIGFIKN